MPHAPTPLRRLAAVLLVTTAAATHAAAQSQIETPTLARAWPDRADAGDTVTLVGTQLDDSGTTLAVTLGTGLACPVTRRTDTAVDITVPAGARSGYAAVTVTKQLPDGTSVSASSNGVPLLVVWTFLDTTGLGPYGSYVIPDNVVVPGPADSVDICFGGWDDFGRVETDLYSVRHDRSVAMVGRNSQDWLSGARVAIDPLSGEVVAAVTVSQYGSFTQYLENLSTGGTLFQFPNDPQGATLMPTAVRFDSSGVLYVAVFDQDELTSIFRFAPGDPIAFDVNGPANMVPGGVALQGFCFDGGDMAVGGNGTVEYIPCSLVEPGKRSDVLRAPGPNGALFETSQLPDFGYTDGTLWYLGARCNGQTLAAGASWGGNSPVSLVDLTDGSVIATIAGLTTLRGFGTDGYDNLYVHGLFPVGGRYRWGLRRLTVGDLPSGFYGTPPPGVAVATQRASALFDAPADPATIPPEWLARRRQRPNAPLIRRFGTRTGQATPEVRNAVPAAPVTAAVTGTFTRARAAAMSPLDLPPGLYCVRHTGNLVLLLTRDVAEPKEEQIPISGGSRASATVLFGQAPLLELGWQDPDGSLIPVKAVWELVPNSEHVISAAPTTLFPERPEIIFAESGLPLSGSSLQFQTVHLGWFDLKVTPSDATFGDPVTIDVNIDVPAGLAGGVPDYDQQIIDAANQYGFPPQVIKSQVDVESAHRWDPNAFRYEARTVDWKDLRAAGVGFWNAALWQFGYYRMPPSSGAYLTAEDIEPRDQLSKISAFDWTLTPPTWPYQCSPLTLSDDPVGIFDLVEADDGWAHCSFPWMQYNDVNNTGVCDGISENRIGPCSSRQNWFSLAVAHTPISYMRHYSQFYCGTDPRSPDCNESNSEAVWLLSQGKTYAAQTPLASSYGLMQVLYTTAVQVRHWHEGAGLAAERHPAYLFDPATSLDLGVGYDAAQTDKWVFSNQRSLSFTCLDEYIYDLTQGLGWYNPGRRPPNLSYSTPIVSNAKSFKPF